MSYYQSSSANLRYATNAGGAWQATTIDSGGDVGKFSSLAVDENDKVHISYYDATNAGLKYATNAPGGWASSTLDGGDLRAFVGQYTSIALGAATVNISYVDVVSGELKYIARCR